MQLPKMAWVCHHLLAAVLLVVVTAAPTKQGFSVHQVSKPVPRKTGAHLTALTYRKYGKKVPSKVEAAIAFQSGSVPANPEEYDQLYLSPVSIGGKEFMLDLDTGSADLWAFSTALPATQQAGHAVYDPAASSTSKLLNGSRWSITYGDGSMAKGNVYSDQVVVGGVTATSQAVEAATSMSSDFNKDLETDGLLGLSFSFINTVRPERQLTFFDNVKSSLPSPVFTVDLRKGAPGTYDFGYIDSSKHCGPITYAEVDSSNGFWQVTITGFTVGDQPFVPSPVDMVVDTGTTLVFLPDVVVSEYYAKVNGSRYSSLYGGYVFPCNTTLPDFGLAFGIDHFSVPGSYIQYAPVSDGSSVCYGGLQPGDDLPFSILGDIYIKGVFLVFEDGSTPCLGIAAKEL